MEAIRRTLPALVLLGAAAAVAGCGGSADPDPPAEPAAGSPSATQTESPSFGSVVAAVEDRVEVYDGVVTGIIALVRVGERTEVVTGGQASVREDLPTDPGQTFPVASITKPMTATVVMQLVEEGLLGLDDPVQDWLPELGPIPSPLTVEQLLSHRSGLPDSGDADIRRVGLRTEDLLRAAAGHGLDFPPGTDGRYTNLGFGALGLLVERVLDQPLRQVFEERLFRPAGMSASSLGGRPGMQGYADGKPVEDYVLELLPGAGSVVATAQDVDAFFRALWDGELVGPDVVASMRESRGQVRTDDLWRPDYGLGLMHHDVSCGPALGHSGRIGGFTVEAWTLEDGSRSTVVAVNDHLANDVARGVVDTVLCG